MVFQLAGLNKSFRVFENIFAFGGYLSDALLDAICPPTCAVCRCEIDDNSEILCRRCWLKLQKNLQTDSCPMCGHNVGRYALIEGHCHRCLHSRPPVKAVARVGDYNDTLRELILSFKFRGQSRLDVFLGGLLASVMIGSPELADVDLLVPVPLHWRRRLSRRYNQSELLARSVAGHLKREKRTVAINLDLLRIRHTPPQTSLSRTDRMTNLKDAFAVRSDSDFADRHICLVDDVSTTGTTLRVAARSLQRAGATRISAAVLAVAAND